MELIKKVVKRLFLLTEQINVMKKMKDIVIVGASGFGREVLQWIKDINKINIEWNILGFVDDNLNALDQYECDYKIISTIEEYHPSDTQSFVCAIANPAIKASIVKLMLKKGMVPSNIIHPSAKICDFTKLGKGCIITSNSLIGPNVCIGDFVSILGSKIGHDASIGNFSTLSGNCCINGHVIVGENVFVANNACVIQGKRIGDNAFVGIGSVVISNIKSNTKVFGNPAKRIEI